MCGIAGWYGGPECPPETLAQMVGTLQHRGPDADGLHEAGPVHLGHRRLSIIDLAASRQPMRNADGSIVLTYNGECYNFQSLRQELEAAGHRFRTDGDTEVLLAAYEQWDTDMLSRLHGMFAFAIWDERKQRLFAARDQLGVKPFYYHWDGNSLVFASELKALLPHPAVGREVDLDAISLYLETQYIPGPRCIYQGVKKLPPAHYLLLENGRLDLERYWQASYTPKLPLGSLDQRVDALEAALRDSVRSMLVSDVPLGAFVSGGIDSSLIAAIMAQECAAGVDTFNLGFLGDHSCSEHDEAELVSKHIGARHHPLMIQPQDVLDEMDRFGDIYDEPFGDQAALPTLLLSRLTREHVTVVLTGEGADEIFAGYKTYQKRLQEGPWPKLLGWPGSPIKPLLRLLPGDIRKDRQIRAMLLPREERYASLSRQFHEEQQSAWYSKAFLHKRQESMRQYGAAAYQDAKADDELDRLLAIDTGIWLPDDLLTKVDRATMAYSLEARVPYLDHGFVDFCASLPCEDKLHNGETKFILKKLAERFLPHDIIYRRKQGFSMPLGDWLADGMATLVQNRLGPDGIQKRGLFNPKRIDHMVTKHLNRSKNYGYRIWTLMMLEQWFARYEPDFRLS